MNINNEEIKRKIESCIDAVKQKFEEKPDIYLTESDIECHLFCKLKKHQEFSQEEKTRDGESSIPLHSEIRWYGETGKLRYRSDIVLLDVSDLGVRDTYFRLPSKGYGFNKPMAIIEIKLRRRSKETDNRFIESIRKEVKKLEEVKRGVGLSDDFPMYLLIFDKKSNIQNKISEFRNTTPIKIWYIYPGANT